MKYIIIMLALVASSNHSLSQYSGYFGKKNFISVSGMGAIPFFYGLDKYPPAYEREGTNLINSRDKACYGLTVSSFHLFSGNFALGGEFGIEKMSMRMPTYMSNYNGNKWNDDFEGEMKHEMVDIKTSHFLIMFEFYTQGDYTGYESYSSDGILPMGFSNQIGIGYSSTKLIDREYLVYFSDPAMDSVINARNIKLPNYKLGGFKLIYQLNFRMPLSKRLLMNYGFRFNLNLHDDPLDSFDLLGNRPGTSYINEDSAYLIDEGRWRKLVAERRFLSIFNLNFGLTYII